MSTTCADTAAAVLIVITLLAVMAGAVAGWRLQQLRHAVHVDRHLLLQRANAAPAGGHGPRRRNAPEIAAAGRGCNRSRR